MIVTMPSPLKTNRATRLTIPMISGRRGQFQIAPARMTSFIGAAATERAIAADVESARRRRV